jgi:DNA-binding response OmpR family regulator
MEKSMVLCIDDEPTVLATRKMVLQAAGFDVLTAADGAAGLELFDTSEIAAVVLDYFMPGTNGGEVAQEMKRRNPKVPIIMLSAYTVLPQDALAAVDVFLTKGESPAIMLGRLRELLGEEPQSNGVSCGAK